MQFRAPITPKNYSNVRRTITSKRGEYVRNKSYSLSSSNSKSLLQSLKREMLTWRTVKEVTLKAPWTRQLNRTSKTKSLSFPFSSSNASKVVKSRSLKMIQRCTSSCQRTKSSPSVTRTISLSAWTSQRQTPRSLPVSLTNKLSSSLRVLSWYKSLCLHLRAAHPTQRCLKLLMVKTQCSMFMKENHQMQIQVWPLVAT